MSLGKPGPYRSPPPRKSRSRSWLCIPARQAHSHTRKRLPHAESILQSKSAASHHGRGASYFVSSESLFQLLCPAPDIPGSVVLDSIHGLSEIRSGAYVFNGPNTMRSGGCTMEDCAATVLVTVVSIARPGRCMRGASYSRCQPGE